MELLIVMTLTSLVIYGAYFSLSSSRNYYNSRVKTLSKSLDLLEWDAQLLKTIRESDNIKLETGSLNFYNDQFIHKLSIRDEFLLFDKDTLKGKVLLKRFYTNKEEVSSGDLIDLFIFDLIINSDTVPLTYEKRYSAFQKLQFETWQE
jgi:hypothetical protein